MLCETVIPDKCYNRTLIYKISAILKSIIQTPTQKSEQVCLRRSWKVPGSILRLDISYPKFSCVFFYIAYTEHCGTIITI